MPTLGGVRPNASLRAARVDAGLSQGQLAELVNAEVEQATKRPGTLDGNTISRLERGVIARPAQRTVDALCAVLACDSARLGFERPTADLAAVEWAAEHPRQTGSEALDALAQILTGLRRLEDQTSPRAVLPVVGHHVRTVEALAREASSAVRPAALELVNEYRVYFGWLLFAVGEQDGARASFDAGLAASVEADSAVGIAHALSFKGYADLHDGHERSAASLVQAANRYEHAPATRTYFHTLAARCLAAGGEISESDRELLKADAMVERVTEENLTGRNYWYQPAWLTVQRGLVHAEAGRTRQAIQDIRDGLAGMPAEHRAAGWAERYADVLTELESEE